MVDRTSVSAPCPGTSSNYVVIISSDWQCSFGIANPVNTGTCPIYLNGLDANGNTISRLPDGTMADLRLNPGDWKFRYLPPDGSVQVVLSCDKYCNGVATLEYDTPNG
jgi:hypothetical protein